MLTFVKMDFMSLHWYGTKANELIAYIELWHNTFGIPIMLTEFACQVRCPFEYIE